MVNVSLPTGDIYRSDFAALQPPLSGRTREVLDLALTAIDSIEQLPSYARAREEEEVRALLGDIETDEQKRRELDEWLRVAAGSGEMRYSVLARLMGVPVVAEEQAVSQVEILQRLESHHYVKEAPRFSDQLADESRKKVEFKFDGQTPAVTPDKRGNRIYETTELRGIREFNEFVKGFIAKSARHLNEANFRLIRNSARSILDNLTYIGSQELDESCAGLAHYWAEYLMRDKANQLCVVTASSLTTSGKRERRATGQSDDFIRDKILENMELAGVPAEVMSRVITSPRNITAHPKNVKVAFTDDWLATARQMRKKITMALPLIDRRYHNSIEVDAITAPPHFVEQGLDVGSSLVPVKVYYRAHKAKAAESEGVGAHITGIHSTVNFGFSIQVEWMQRLLNQIKGPQQPLIRMPAVASVYRSYWN
jgi:hypothetical protein